MKVSYFSKKPSGIRTGNFNATRQFSGGTASDIVDELQSNVDQVRNGIAAIKANCGGDRLPRVMTGNETPNEAETVNAALFSGEDEVPNSNDEPTPTSVSELQVGDKLPIGRGKIAVVTDIETIGQDKIKVTLNTGTSKMLSADEQVYVAPEGTQVTGEEKKEEMKLPPPPDETPLLPDDKEKAEQNKKAEAQDKAQGQENKKDDNYTEVPEKEIVSQFSSGKPDIATNFKANLLGEETFSVLFR